MKGSYQNIHPFSKIAIIALVAIVSLVVVLIVASVMSIPIFGSGAFMGMMQSVGDVNAENLALLKYLQMAQSIGLFIVPSFILAYLFGNKIVGYLCLSKSPHLISIVLATVIVFSASPLVNLVGQWNSQMTLPAWLSDVEQWMRDSEDSAKRITELFVYTDSIGGLLFNIFMIALIPAIGEEFLFRGVLQRVLTDWFKNKHAAIWLTAILFSALHMQFYGFVPRALLGAMFGYLLIWSGNLWLPVIAHFINNAVAVIAYYMYDKGTIAVNPDEIGTDSEYGIAGIFSAVVVVALFYAYYKYEKRKL